MISPLPFQDVLEEISSQLTMLREQVNPHSELGEAIDVCIHKLEPFFNNVEFSEPVPISDLQGFRSYLSGMKL